MTIWILAAFLFGAVGALGRQVGGIRMGVSLIGVIVALFVAGPLAPHIRTALGAVGVKNPITIWALAAPLAFLSVMMAFNSAAIAAYLKIGTFYNHRATDDVRMRWQRLEAGTGLGLGIAAAVAYLLAASAYVYHVGYITKQLESPNGNPLWMTVVNKMRSDLTDSKFDRVAAGVGQASPKFFQTADLLGLLYHNPELQQRMTEYPQFLSLTENGTFQNVFTNETFAVLLPAKTNITFILKDPIGGPLLLSPEFRQAAEEIDLPDLIAYLKTGVSEKYAKEPLVGKWLVDMNSTIRQYARANPKASANDQGRLRNLLRFVIADYTMTITPDEKVYVKGRRDPLPFAALLAPGVRLPGVDTNMPIRNVFSGSWKKDGDKFQFTLQAAQGERTANVNIVENGKLATMFGPATLVFDRAN